ncbi:MAG TPA: murein L,D-transpeptidase catalytic domain family protein [Candidatus Sulfomarinibacteraceae bacterium]|nr:murein L,D-transpeptidase catalytic domain family protein [Candidatus Sulfomarinibacteraceae bacterium]
MRWNRPTTLTAVVLAVIVSATSVQSSGRTQPPPSSNPPAGLRPEVYGLALRAYRVAEAQGLVTRPRMTVVDLELPSYARRLWVLDMATGEVLFHEWVAHGMGSPRGTGGDLVKVLSFSNREHTRMSSLGLYRTAETYVGRHGRSLRLDGLEPGINDAARRRTIVVHGADYVSRQQARLGRMGRSWGCPAVRPEIAQSLIDAISGGSLLWIYYPDQSWLASSDFLASVTGDGRRSRPSAAVNGSGGSSSTEPVGQ